MTKILRIVRQKGGRGSGHHGHRGRPRRRGGSLPRGSAYPVSSKWHGPRTRDKKRDKLVRNLSKELDETWPTSRDVPMPAPGEDISEYEDRQDRARRARDVGDSAISDFKWAPRNTHLLVRREKGELVGVASMTLNRGDLFAALEYLATREKGNGTIMMIEAARKALSKGMGLTGSALDSALTFYTELAESMGVGHLMTRSGTTMRIRKEALEVMLEPLKDLKEKDAERALDFVMEFMENEPEGGDVYFDKRLDDKGGAGSGHHGHAGRPGMVGGSAPAETATATGYTHQVHDWKPTTQERRDLVGDAYAHLEDHWNPDNIGIDRGSQDYPKQENRYLVGRGAVEDYVFSDIYKVGIHLRHDEDGVLVGVMSTGISDDGEALVVRMLATREKGNGTIMMIRAARAARDAGLDLYGEATWHAREFYLGLAKSMGVEDELKFVGGGSLGSLTEMIISNEALQVMLEPLEGLKGETEAIEFVSDFAFEDEGGVWFAMDETFASE